MTLARVLVRQSLAIVALLFVSAPASLAAPQSAPAFFDEFNLSARAELRWPEEVRQGYMPLFIELENEGDSDRVVEIEATCKSWGRAKHKVTRLVSVPARERVETELFVPAFQSAGSVYRVRFTSSGRDESVWVSDGSTGVHANSVPILIVSAEEPTAAEIGLWREAIVGASAAEDDQSISDSTAATEGEGQSLNVFLAAISPERAARRLEAYTSLHAVVLDTRTPPSATQLEPVLAWARLGGTLAILGPSSDAYARSIPGAASWMEERFRLDRGGDVFHIGHGRLIVGEDDELFGRRDARTLGRVVQENDAVAPDPDQPSRLVEALSVPGVKALPYRLFIGFLVLFALLIGPINFFAVKKSGRPAFLLVTIPLLALSASAGILTYGIFYQGLELKEHAQTFTVLDQREHRSDTVMLRSFFAGLSPADGLRPALGTVCFPASSLADGRERYYLIDLDRSPVMSGEFMPVRREGTQLVLSERAARARLTFERTDDGVRVENGLSVAVEKLSYRAADGSYFTYGLATEVALEPIAAGSKALLEPSPARRPVDWLVRPVNDRDCGWFSEQPESTYVATIEDNPFADRVGLEPDVQVGVHVLLGVLAANESERGQR